MLWLCADIQDWECHFGSVDFTLKQQIVQYALNLMVGQAGSIKEQKVMVCSVF